MLMLLGGCPDDGSDDDATTVVTLTTPGTSTAASTGPTDDDSSVSAEVTSGTDTGETTSDSGNVDTGTDSGDSGDSTESTTTGPVGPPPTLDTLREVVQVRCALGGCHNGEVEPTLINDGQLYTNLTTSISNACGNLPIVSPGNPDGSAIVRIINEPCGSAGRMPFGCIDPVQTPAACLPQEYIDAIEQWVASGAPQ